MKKQIVVGNFNDVQAAAKGGLRGIVVMGRSKNEVWSKNLMAEGIEIKLDKESGVVTMSFILNEGDMVLIQDNLKPAEEFKP
jgi:hypothetical protein